MLRKCTNQEIPRAAEFIGEDRLLCFYLYMDMLSCGAEGEGLGLWFSENEDNALNAVLYRYYDALHIYCRGECPAEDCLSLITGLDPKVVTGRQKDIDILFPSLKGSYVYELSHIITADKMMDGKSDLEVLQADESDIPEIASLMMKEPIYNSVYTYESLCESLARRIREGFGRLFVMRTQEGRLVATNATNAETEDLAVISGLVTDPEMRGKGLGRAITASTWNLVKKEGKRGLAFLGAENENTLSLHRKMGYTFLGLYARLVRED